MDVCDFNTITGKYVYFKLWGQAIEDGLALLGLLISAITFAFVHGQRYFCKRD